MPAVYDNAQKLQSLGVPTPLARELRAQITANVGDYRRLQELGMPEMLAKYVADTITTGPMVAVQLTRRGMDSVVAPVLTAMVNA